MIFVLANSKPVADEIIAKRGLLNEETQFISSPRPIRGKKDTTLIIVSGWQTTRCKLQRALINAEILIYQINNTVIYHEA